MFTLNRNDFRVADTNRLVEFVECWNRYYRGNDDEYCAALNLGNDLTKQHISRLLRWKDPRFLTHPNQDGSPNPRVERVLERTASINDFRNGRIDADVGRSRRFAPMPGPPSETELTQRPPSTRGTTYMRAARKWSGSRARRLVTW